MTTESNRPSHGVYIVEGEGKKALWTKIGAAWTHEGGEGFTINLTCLPAAERPPGGPQASAGRRQETKPRARNGPPAKARAHHPPGRDAPTVISTATSQNLIDLKIHPKASRISDTQRIRFSAATKSLYPEFKALHGGLLTSTFLSLLVITVIFTFVDDLLVLISKPFKHASPANAPAERLTQEHIASVHQMTLSKTVRTR